MLFVALSQWGTFNGLMHFNSMYDRIFELIEHLFYTLQCCLPVMCPVLYYLNQRQKSIPFQIKPSYNTKVFFFLRQIIYCTESFLEKHIHHDLDGLGKKVDLYGLIL